MCALHARNFYRKGLFGCFHQKCMYTSLHQEFCTSRFLCLLLAVTIFFKLAMQSRAMTPICISECMPHHCAEGLHLVLFIKSITEEDLMGCPREERAPRMHRIADLRREKESRHLSQNTSSRSHASCSSC